VKFDSNANLAPQQFQVTFQNLKNPNSVNPPGDIQITTLMHYSQSDFYFNVIDQYKGTSGFQATRGTIFPATMSTISKTLDLSTYADNQQYEIKFQPSHRVSSQGFLRVTIPPLFEMSSESSAVS
jgi:hypothetical protein